MIPWYLLKIYAQKNPSITGACIALLLSNIYFYNFYFFFLLIWAFLTGVAVTNIFLRPSSLIPNLLPMYVRKHKKDDEDDELTLMKTVCTVCGLKKCPRHRPELNILAFQPWTNLDVREKVDQALDELLNLILKDHVYTWYRDLSKDEEFVDELKTNIRFLASVLFRRLKKIDIPKLVTERLLQAGIRHIDTCVQAYREAPAGCKGDFQQTVLDFLGPRVHCAMWSRKAELEYLRRLVEVMFPYILRPQALNSSVCFTETDDFDRESFVPVLKSTCALVREILAGSVLLPAMDALANPDLVNNLMLIYFDNTPPPEATEPPSVPVPFLGQFSTPQARNQSSLRLELKDVITPGSPETLYPFMQFLKSEAAVNVLQFCLACEDFNRKILSPDVSQSEFVDLHKIAKDLYNMYCAPNALDRIKFEEDIVETLREVIEGPPDQVVRLRTSTPLFRAYEHAYDLLENNFLPLFHQSDDYYNMICGGRPNLSLSRQASKVPKKKDFTLSQFGNKLKEVFRSSEDKNSALDVPDERANNASLFGVDEVSSEDEVTITDHSLHDLSCWRVTIPRIGARPDPDNMRKQYFVFIIDVRRVEVLRDTEEKSQWTVARRYPEFYVLEQKLSEFHGEFIDCQLPPKKSFGTKTQEFTESKMLDFEQYLQKLLTQPVLKNSELLYNFLTSESEFSTSLLPDLKLGNFKRKLVKEKGQHLDPFLVNFALSTEAPKPKAGRLTRRGSEVSLVSTSSEKLGNTQYEDNVSSGFSPPLPKADVKPKYQDVDGAFDSVIFVLKEIFEIPEWMLHLLLSSRILLKKTVETYLDYYLGFKVSQITQEHRVVSLIHLLRDVLFFDTDPPRTDADKKKRYDQTLKEFIEYIPGPLAYSLGQDKTKKGCLFLLQIFQQPKLNKQLSYVLLDIVAQELFEELSLPSQAGE